MPDSVISIGNGAFQNCSNLQNIILSDSITAVGESAFNGCSSLTSIQIPNGVKSIGNFTFNGCSSLTNIMIPDSVTNIGWWAFSGCSSLTSLIIPKGITSVESSAFMNCTSLTSIKIPDGVTIIGYEAFHGCLNLANITIPDSMVSISSTAFYNTAVYNNLDNWQNGMLIIDGWLIAVDENTQHLSRIEDLRGVATDAYLNAYRLQTAVWEANVTPPSNVETLYITNIKEYMGSIPQHLTLKNIIICDTVDATALRYCEWLFNYVTGVTIFVEGYEEDLRWDANFPSWSNGNRVVYSDSWTWSNFYDADGTLLYSKPRLNSEIIRMPVVDDYESEDNCYKFLGWDLNNDGEIDSVPATSTVDINAHAVYVKYSYCALFGHTIVQISAKPATCTSIGWNEYDKCSRCDYSTYVELPMLDHKYISSVIKPDYQVQGYTLHTCEVCGYSFKDNYTDALTYLPGDINGDGKVEKVDASVLIKYIVGENVTVIPEALDINLDGKVTIVDAITILLYLAGKVESLN